MSARQRATALAEREAAERLLRARNRFALSATARAAMLADERADAEAERAESACFAYFVAARERKANERGSGGAMRSARLESIAAAMRKAERVAHGEAERATARALDARAAAAAASAEADRAAEPCR